jgi:hypothetical protein
LAVGFLRPLFAVTFSKVPSPRFRKRVGLCPLYDSGVQYDFRLPSSVQCRSLAGAHST